MTGGQGRVCRVCGAALPPRHTAYCSTECARAGANHLQRVKERKPRPISPIYRERACMDCGKVMLMHIKSKRCPDCQREATLATGRIYRQRMRRGLTRQIGSVDTCLRCGEPYTVAGGQQKYCKDCAAAAWRENDRAASRASARERLSSLEYRAARNAKRREEYHAKRAERAVSAVKDKQD